MIAALAAAALAAAPQTPEALIRHADAVENAIALERFEDRAFLTRPLLKLCELKRGVELNDRFDWELLWGAASGEDPGAARIVSLARIPADAPGVTRVRATYRFEGTPRRRVRVDYDVVDDAGAPRIADIHYHARGLPASLRAYLQRLPTPPQS